MDETGLQLIFSDKDKVLAEKGSKRVHVATHGEQGDTIMVIACSNASGNWIPPMVLYKGVHEKKVFGDGLPTGSMFYMTPKIMSQQKFSISFCDISMSIVLLEIAYLFWMDIEVIWMSPFWM